MIADTRSNLDDTEKVSIVFFDVERTLDIIWQNRLIAGTRIQRSYRYDNKGLFNRADF